MPGRRLLQLFTSYVIICFVTACSSQQIIVNDVTPESRLIQGDDGNLYQVTEDAQLQIQGKYDLYLERGLEFVWHINNKGEAPVDFDMNNVVCTLQHEDSSDTVPAFNPQNPNTDFSGAEKNDVSAGEVILTIIGIVLIVGIIFLIAANNDDDQGDEENHLYTDNDDNKETIIIQQKTEIHVYDDTPVTVVQSADQSKQTIIVGHTDGNSSLDSHPVADTIPVFGGNEGIQSGEAYSTRIRCPHVPPRGPSALTIQAGIAGKQYLQTYQLFREEPAPPPRRRPNTQT